MTCIRIPGGILCVADAYADLTPYGSAVMVEHHRWLGPRFETKQGREINKPSKRTWAAFEAWLSTTAAPDGEGEK